MQHCQTSMSAPVRIFTAYNKPIRKPVIIIDRIKNSAGEVYAVMSYDAEKNYLLMKWIGFSSEEEVKGASLKMLEWQRNEGIAKSCKFHVHDTKEIEGAWIGLVEWIDKEMFPHCYKAGLRYNLSVTSPDLFSKMSSKALQEKRSTLVPTILFETLASAEAWLTKRYKSI